MLVSTRLARLFFRVRSEKILRIPRANHWLERLAIALTVVLVSWFYAWTVDPDRVTLLMKESRGYYSLLAQGFLKGQLALDLPADPILATLKNPYDPVQRAGHGLHDASYYQGKYYLYFGVTPALALFVPVRLLTGRVVDESSASLLFSVVGFCLAVIIFVEIRRRWFLRTPPWLVIVGVLMLGLGTLVPALLRRPGVWETPISCAYAFFMVTLFCILRSLTAKQWEVWLAVASVAMGWCIGARPTYLPGALVLLVPIGARLTRLSPRERWRAGLCALVPIASVGAILAAYNFFRFGNILDFGWTYQMGGGDISGGKLFSTRVLAFNLRLYLFAAAGLSPFFPFVTVASLPPVPPEQIGVENAYGLLPNLPWVALAAAAWLTRNPIEDRTRRWFCTAILAASTATFLCVCGFRGAAGRYEVDFAPGWILLAAVGALAWPEWFGGAGRRIAWAVTGGLAGWSALFGVMVSLQHNELLRAEHAATYHRIAHAFNWPSRLIDRLLGTQYGAVELTAVFPRNAAGQIEPLVATGHAFRADYVYVHYLDETTVRFGFEHTSRAGAVGPPIKISPGVPQVIRIDMGSLYPPVPHPWFDQFSPPDIRLLTRTLRVTINGQIALQRVLEFYDAAERQPGVGTAGDRPALRRNFSGQLLGWKRLRDNPPKAIEAQSGVLQLRVQWPPFGGRWSEPLLSTGETGKGDLVLVTYEDETHVSFSHDRWGFGGATSANIEIDRKGEHILEVSCPPLLGSGASPGLRVKLDGREVFATSEAFHACEPDTIAIGANQIQASSARMLFTGNILSAARISP